MSRLTMRYAISKVLDAALACPDCEKQTSVRNTKMSGRGFVTERVTRETHCACPGGPAAALPELPAVPEHVS